MCPTNSNDGTKTYYCHTEGKIVSKEQVIEICDPFKHDLDTSEDKGDENEKSN